jgi:hypothetical protein
MKRDIELIRNLLLLIECHPQANAPDIIEVPGYQKDTINYHLALLLDASLIEGTTTMVRGQDYPEVSVHRLTWAGHDFLETAREDTVWKRALTILANKGGAITFDILRALLVVLAKTAVGLGP